MMLLYNVKRLYLFQDLSRSNCYFLFRFNHCLFMTRTGSTMSFGSSRWQVEGIFFKSRVGYTRILTRILFVWEITINTNTWFISNSFDLIRQRVDNECILYYHVELGHAFNYCNRYGRYYICWGLHIHCSSLAYYTLVRGRKQTANIMRQWIHLDRKNDNLEASFHQ